MSDPYAHHPSENLEMSTAMTSVGEEAMNHAASEAARLVKAVASAKSHKSSRKAKSMVPATESRMPPSAASTTEASVELTTIGVDAFPETDLTDVEAAQGAGFVASNEVVTSESDVFERIADDGLAAREPVLDDDATLTDPSEMIPEYLADELIADMHFKTEAAEAPVATADAFVQTMNETFEARDGEHIPTGGRFGDAAGQTMASTEPSMKGVEAASVEVAPSAAASALSQDADILVEFGNKLAQSMQGNIGASITFWMSIFQVKNPAEAVELNAAHLRWQMQSFLANCEDLSGLARKAFKISMVPVSRPWN